MTEPVPSPNREPSVREFAPECESWQVYRDATRWRRARPVDRKPVEGVQAAVGGRTGGGGAR